VEKAPDDLDELGGGGGVERVAAALERVEDEDDRPVTRRLDDGARVLDVLGQEITARARVGGARP
jgi:hypothetical protein